jgi:hypothetical protein
MLLPVGLDVHDDNLIVAFTSLSECLPVVPAHILVWIAVLRVVDVAIRCDRGDDGHVMGFASLYKVCR